MGFFFQKIMDMYIDTEGIWTYDMKYTNYLFFCFIIGGSVQIVGFFPVFSESQNGYVLIAT